MEDFNYLLRLVLGLVLSGLWLLVLGTLDGNGEPKSISSLTKHFHRCFSIFHPCLPVAGPVADTAGCVAAPGRPARGLA